MIKKILLFTLSVLAAGPPSACSFLSDLTRMDRPKISFIRPEEEYLVPGEFVEFHLGFSAEMRRARTEEAFSLRDESAPVPGTFQWRDGGGTLVFRPLAPLRIRSTFTLRISAAAEDRHGNSLGEEFTRTFHTRSDTEGPRVVSALPPPGSLLSSFREPVCLNFSEPMDRRETESRFSLIPGLTGFFSWNEASDSLTWTPLEDYKAGGHYEAALGRDARDLSGNPLTEEFSFRFSVPEKNIRVLSVRTVSGDLLVTEAPEGSLCDDSLLIEKDDEFRITFSAPVGRDERNSAVSIIPSTAFTPRWEKDAAELLLSFPDGLLWNRIYEIRVLKKTFRFRVNGERSVPLGVRRATYIEDTLAVTPAIRELLLARDYSFPSRADAAFDLYISHGKTALPVLASFLRAFSAEPGAGCLTVNLNRVEQGPSLPPPIPAPGPGETVFRVHCEILSLPASGTLTLRLGSDLRDLWDNRLPAPYVLTVNKP